MIFTNAEIEVLSLLAACRDAPAEILSLIGQEITETMLNLKFMSIGRNGLTVRVTPEGHRLLQKAGRDYPSDGQYRCVGKVLERRFITAHFLFWLRSCGVKHFPQKPVMTEGLAFLPSFMFRREKGRNVLGGVEIYRSTKWCYYRPVVVSGIFQKDSCFFGIRLDAMYKRQYVFH